jgi:hypothetical protein
VTSALFADHIERALLGAILEAPVLIEGIVDLAPQDLYVLRDSETIALDDAAEAILKVVPSSESSASTASELFEASGVKRTAGQEALTRLIQQEKVQRKGSGHKGDAFRFYATKIHSAGNASFKRRMNP